MRIPHLLSLLLATSLAACGGGGGGGTSSTPSAIIGIALDSTTSPSKLYVSNTDKNVVQTLTLSTSAVATVAGKDGVAGIEDGTGGAARFYAPFGIALGGSDLYVADTFSHTIRKLTSAGVVSTLAGSAGNSGANDGTGSSARFMTPKSLSSDGTSVYVTDSGNHTIRKITLSTGATTTVAGYAGTLGSSDGSGSAARFNAPFGITQAGTNLYVTDTQNHTVRVIDTTNGAVTTLAGVAASSGSNDSSGSTAAKFNTPTGIVSDGTSLYVADTLNHVIRKIVMGTGAVSTLAGTAGSSGAVDGTGAAARFNQPVGLALDTTNGILYVSDQNYSKIRKVVISTGAVSTVSASF